MNETDLSKLDLNLLKSFQVLINERHVGRAAEKMNVSQSAMSHTLSRLRKAFNDDLFVRNAKGMEPNANALKLAGKVAQILGDISTLLGPSEFDPATIDTHFRIQTHAYIAAIYLPALISRIRRYSPGIVFDLQSITSTYSEQLNKDQSDLIIGAGFSASQQFKQARFAEDTLCCLVDKRHPALREWTPANIFNYPHIKLTLLEDRDDPVTQYCLNNGHGKRQIGLYTETLHMQVSFLAGTNLIAFVPMLLAQQAAKIHKLKIMTCPFELPALNINGIWHSRHENDTAHTWIRSELLKAVK
jgi:DNA-binding transcriptional LysR family regulator